ncbi:MAG: lipopolysaccharide heptosyltransferase II [Verrucomicrobiales bacterium]|jgi:heptosyltransferase-2|nr:lipopolysaccharide heptosyltransferase II [Verrucomicrobiales bacterium]
MEKLLLRSPNWLGDAVLTLPAVQQLTAGGRQPAVLCPEKLRDFWRLIPGVGDIISVRPKPRDTAKLLREKNFTTALLFPNSLTVALEAWLARVPRRCGFHGHHRRWLLTQSWPRPAPIKGYIHQAKQNLALLQHLGITVSGGFKPIPQPAPADRQPAKPYLAVCPGAAHGPAKRWPTERFAAVINRLRADRDLAVVILGAAADVKPAARLALQSSKPVINLAGQTTLAEFLALIARARLVLCNDSGAMHAAAMFGAPAVAIFGSTEPRLTAPLGDTVSVIREHVPCSPCFLRACPLDRRCQTAVTPAQVTAACAEKLNHSIIPLS